MSAPQRCRRRKFSKSAPPANLRKLSIGGAGGAENEDGRNFSISAPQATKILMCERAAGDEKFSIGAPQATKISMCERAAGEENTTFDGATQERKSYNGRAAGEENF